MTGSYSPSDSPTETRAKRHAGDGFYRDRGRPLPRRHKSGTEKRNGRRSPAERETAALARDLDELSRRFPHFRGPLNRLRHHVLVQMRRADWKCGAVLGCLNYEDPLAIEEIVEETDLDRQSIEQSLTALETKGEAARCNRNGAAVVIRRDGKPAEKVYWLKATVGANLRVSLQ